MSSSQENERWRRERAARKEAERLLEAKSRELYFANEELRKLNKTLEDRVAERTQELQASGQALIEKDREQRVVYERLLRTQFSVDRAGDALFWLDRRGKFNYVNNTACRWMQYSRAELLAMSVFDIDQFMTPEIWEEHWVEVRTRKSFTIASEHRRRDGSVFPVEVTVNYSNFLGKEFNCAFVRDITLRVETEERLQEALEEAQKADRAKSQFLAMMSHEIRTPMTAIVGYSELLTRRSEDDSGEEREWSHRLRANSDYLLSLLDEILDFSKIESGRMELRIKRVDLRLKLLELERLISPRAEEKGIAFNLTCHSLLPEAVETDPVRFHQVLMNLCGNAIKFTSEGEVKVGVNWSQEEGCLIVRVVDTGCGIAEEHQKEIFEAFAQVSEAQTQNQRGTGLGLAISLRLARLLGGKLEVESQQGEGAQFTLTLPMKETKKTKSFRPVPKKDEESALQGIEGLSILIVDDNPENEKILRFLLEDEGAEVQSLSDGHDAVEWLQSISHREYPDLVLMDVMMPVMDGYAATRRFRELGFKAPIVALTAFAMAGDEEKCLAAGCDNYLTKPFVPEELKSLVLDLTGRSGKARSGLDPAQDPELTKRFRSRLAELQGILKSLMARKDWASIQVEAHKIKGVASQYGYPELGNVAKSLEVAIRQGEIPEARLSTLADQFLEKLRTTIQ